MKPDNTTILFHETQRFTQPWIYVLVAGGAMTIWGWMIAVLFLGAGAEMGLVDNIILDVVFVLVGLGLPLLFVVTKLTVTVLPGRIEIHFPPFLRRTIKVEEIASFEARTYRPILEYGGWGLRGSLKNGMAYNVKGDEGVQLVFENGKKLLIGSQRAGTLEAAIARAKNI